MQRLIEKMDHSDDGIVIVALYKFVLLEDYQTLRQPLLQQCLKAGIKGTLLLAREGINGTIAGRLAAIEELIQALECDERLRGIEYKASYHDSAPFHRMKIKLKKEIVTMGVDFVDPNKVVGTYVEPKDWNALISDPDVVVLDTRNDYEYCIGTFEGAIDPGITTFRELPEYVDQHLDPGKHKKVAMFCTGGIRCEKSTAYLREKGFDEVFHLKGGILKYLEEVPEQESLWRGECFVFDGRVAVDHQLQKGSYDQCFGCRRPITEEEKTSPNYLQGVACPHCYDSLTEDQKSALASGISKSSSPNCGRSSTLVHRHRSDKSRLKTESPSECSRPGASGQRRH